MEREINSVVLLLTVEVKPDENVSDLERRLKNHIEDTYFSKEDIEESSEHIIDIQVIGTRNLSTKFLKNETKNEENNNVKDLRKLLYRTIKTLETNIEE